MDPSSQHEKIFFNGEEYFSSLLLDIENAAYSIDLETYIFELDTLGKKMIAALTDAASRGISVRVLVDGAGTPNWGGNLIESLEQAGAKTQIFHPFPWRLWQWSRSFIRLPHLVKAIYLILKINSRNHRKTCLIDKKIAYVGSFNISSEHLNSAQNGIGWRDTGVRLQNVNLSELHKSFDLAWHHHPLKERIRHFFRHIYNNPIIRVNNSWYRRHILYKNLLKKIAHCQNRVWITNAYFVPDNFLLKRLVDAAERKIDVRILLPRKSDLPFMPLTSNNFYQNLLCTGARIFEYLPSILHAKTLIIDDWMTIGSSNLNYRSILHDLEIDVNVHEENSKKLLEKQFLIDLENSREITWADWKKRSFLQKLIGQMLLYIKYWL
jgi:cardiolipin synthase A/B